MDGTTSPISLFCVPHAGGDAWVFSKWSKILSPIKVVPLVLPGRGNYSDLHVDTFQVLVNHCVSQYMRNSDSLNNAMLFGHSMGAIVAFEMARQLQQQGFNIRRLFVSGMIPPAHWKTDNLSSLPDEELLGNLHKLGGLQDEALRDPVWINYFIPIIRYDLRLCENYQFRPGSLLKCPISVLSGSADEACPTDNLDGWSSYTSNQTTINIFDGGHFSIYEQESLLKNIFFMN